MNVSVNESKDNKMSREETFACLGTVHVEPGTIKLVPGSTRFHWALPTTSTRPYDESTWDSLDIKSLHQSMVWCFLEEAKKKEKA